MLTKLSIFCLSSQFAGAITATAGSKLGEQLCPCVLNILSVWFSPLFPDILYLYYQQPIHTPASLADVSQSHYSDSQIQVLWAGLTEAVLVNLVPWQ